MDEKRNKTTIVIPVQSPVESKKIRIAAYCRVSTQAEEQNNSLMAQIDYYTKLYADDEKYELVGVYADRGTSGTRTRNREEFLKLIEDCRERKIDAVITKSVSRFGRNTVDTLMFTRELKELGIDVFFEKENLHTYTAEGELLLTLIAAVAESEAVSLSDNVKWGKRHRYKKGIVESLPSLLATNSDNHRESADTLPSQRNDQPTGHGGKNQRIRFSADATDAGFR